MLTHREREAQSWDSTSTESDPLMLADPNIWEVEEPGAGAPFGATFFGSLVATAMVILIAATIAAVSAVAGFPHTADRTTFVLVSGGLLSVPLILGLFAGGYVAGRMVRAHGGRQGLAVWFFGLLVLVILAALGYAAQREYDLLALVDWPVTPIQDGSATTTDAVLMSLTALTTLVAAVAWGRRGSPGNSLSPAVDFR